jgi:segregation and condensation protein A
MSYEVRTPVFEGPLDLLLHLIMREQVDLYALSIGDLVDAYLAEMERLLSEAAMASEAGGEAGVGQAGGGEAGDGKVEDGKEGTERRIDLDTATEFLLVAATLVELKTRRLLPSTDDGDLDDDLALWEERDLLLARLIECKTFKNAAAVLAGLLALADRSVPRRVGPEERFGELQPDLLAGVGPEDLRAALMRAMRPRPAPRVDLGHIAAIRASVTDAVAELLDELPRSGHLSFRQLTAGLVDRVEVVVRFLAVLELFKQGLVDLHQPSTFGDIRIEWVGPTDAAVVDLDLVESYDG